jgi:hypothetical protein
MTIHTKDKDTLALCRRAFPGAEDVRSEIRIEQFPDYGITPTSYWNDGHRDHWAFVALSENCENVAKVPENGSGFTRDVAHIGKLPNGIALVCLTYSGSGKPYFTVYANSVDITPLLPSGNLELSMEEKEVLRITKGFKPSYRKELFSRMTKFFNAEEVKASLVKKGLLDKRGAITIEGKNAFNAVFSGAVQPRSFYGNGYN